MLTAHQLSKSFATEYLFKNVGFSVNAGERVGLIGPNGSGKTTLLRILAGVEPPDAGHVALAAGCRVGYLPQGSRVDPELTLAEAIGRAAGDKGAELATVAAALAQDPDRTDLQHAYDALLRQVERFDPGRAPALLAALGLDDVDGRQPVGTLSGGEKTRLSLALVLLREPDLLLLDEPTNHLDIAMLEWLEGWLASFPGAALIVSHDRVFLDRTVSKILALDPEEQLVQEYAGNYGDYLEQFLLDRAKQWAAYKDQIYEIRRLRQDIARAKEQARRSEGATIDSKARRYAKKVAQKAKSREKRLERFLESEERVEKPAQSWQMKLEFAPPAHLGQDVLRLEQVTVGHPGGAPLLRGLALQVSAGQRIVLTGANGCGKTTLLRTIAGEMAPLAGRVQLGASARLGYMSQEQRLLDGTLTALEMIQEAAPLNETEARSFLHFFLFTDDDPLRSIHKLSYGERARLALALLVARGCNFLLLDEPLNHLDIPSRSRFEEALSNFSGTTLAVVHDRMFIERFATDIWRVKYGTIRHEP